ncbi:hypothetical protein ES703_114140 [subsurface metagenome]
MSPLVPATRLESMQSQNLLGQAFFSLKYTEYVRVLSHCECTRGYGTERVHPEPQALY